MALDTRRAALVQRHSAVRGRNRCAAASAEPAGVGGRGLVRRAATDPTRRPMPERLNGSNESGEEANPGAL